MAIIVGVEYGERVNVIALVELLRIWRNDRLAKSHSRRHERVAHVVVHPWEHLVAVGIIRFASDNVGERGVADGVGDERVVAIEVVFQPC